MRGYLAQRLPRYFLGFAPSRQTAEPTLLLQLAAQHARVYHKELYVAKIDLVKAFDSVQHMDITYAADCVGQGHLPGFACDIYGSSCRPHAEL